MHSRYTATLTLNQTHAHIHFAFESSYTVKKKIKFSSYIRKFRMEQLPSHIWITASSYMGKYLRKSSYNRKPFLIYDFTTSPLWISLYTRKIWFSFLSVNRPTHPHLNCNNWWLDFEKIALCLYSRGISVNYSSTFFNTASFAAPQIPIPPCREELRILGLNPGLLRLGIGVH